MEDASLQTHAKVSYLAVTGPATSANASSFLGSLLVRKCEVVVAAGGPEQEAVLAEAARFPGVKFILAGAGTSGPVSGANVAIAPAAQSRLRGAVASMVAADARN